MAGSHRRDDRKITRLVAFLEEHAEAIEADLQHYHQVDLRDLWRGDLTYRRLDVLLRFLPMESATQTAVWADLSAEEKQQILDRRDDSSHGPWSLTDLLLAGVIDSLNIVDYHQLLIAGAKSVQAPEPVNRPGLELRRLRRALSSKGVAYLNRIRKQREES